MLVSDFDFHLPDELIAQEAAPRGESRLLALDRRSGETRDLRIGDLPSLLRAGDLLVVNDTRVFAARLLGHRVPSGGAVECLLLGPPIERHADGAALFEALVHPGQKLKPGARVRFEGPAGALNGEIRERRFFGRRTLELTPDGGTDLDALVDALGHVPLPPYIRRPDEARDRERYQTVYARTRGSVAAPTAGLHFTPELLAALDVERVTLHVGLDTFRPVAVTELDDHELHGERYEVSPEAWERIRGAERVLAVGTTTVRVLETLARGGPLKGRTSLFVTPGFRFERVDALLTNFHLPRSTLLALVMAFAGVEQTRSLYELAVAEGYRFYSFGDAMLIL